MNSNRSRLFFFVAIGFLLFISMDAQAATSPCYKMARYLGVPAGTGYFRMFLLAQLPAVTTLGFLTYLRFTTSSYVSDYKLYFVLFFMVHEMLAIFGLAFSFIYCLFASIFFAIVFGNAADQPWFLLMLYLMANSIPTILFLILWLRRRG